MNQIVRPAFPRNRVVSREEWLKARKAHLKNEKALTRMRDMVERRAARAALGEGRKGLRVRHRRAARRRSPSCSAATASSSCITSCGAGTWTRAARAARCRPITPKARWCIWRTTTSVTCTSRAGRSTSSRPISKRLGWKATCVSSYGSDFNFDYHVSFTDEQMANGKLDYNYQTIDWSHGLERTAGLQRLHQERGRRGVPHLLQLRARQRRGDRRVHLSRHRHQRAATRTRSWTG